MTRLEFTICCIALFFEYVGVAYGLPMVELGSSAGSDFWVGLVMLTCAAALIIFEIIYVIAIINDEYSIN